MSDTFDQAVGVGTRPVTADRASWTRQGSGDRSLRVGRSGIGGFDPERLRAMRERADVTQRDLAERLLRATKPEWPGDKITRAAQDLENVRLQVTDYEAGQVVPRADMLFQLAQALGGDVFDLLDPQTPYTLETLRARQGLLQADVVTRGELGVGRAYYSRVERGKATLSEEDTRKLAGVLQVEPDDLAAAIAGGRTVGSVTRA